MKLTCACALVVNALAISSEMFEVLRNPLTEESLAYVEQELSQSLGKEKTGSPLFADLSKMINDTMAPAILTAHDAAVSQLDGFRTAFDACGVPDVPSAKLNVKGVTTSGIADKLEEHRQCRAKENTAKGAADKCNTDLGKEETVQKAACDAVPGSDGSPPPLDKDKHVGCKVTDGDYEGWVNSFESQIDQLKKQYDDAAGGCGNASKVVDDMKPKCQAADGEATGNKTACDALQKAADAMGCAANPTAHASCKTYTECFDEAERNYLDANESIAAAQVNRTVQWRVLKRMQCLLAEEAAGATHEGIDACKDATVDTSHLDLVYPDIPYKFDCSHIVGGPLPCTDEWTALYGDLPANAPASPCTPCPELVPGTYTIMQKYSGRYMDSYLDGNDFDVVTRAYEDNGSQKWIIVPAGPNVYTIEQLKTGRVLDAYEDQGNDYNVVMRDLNADREQAQRFEITSAGNFFTIMQKSSGRYFDAYTHANHDYKIVTRPASGHDAQKWEITMIQPLKPLKAGTYTIQQKVNRRFLDAYENDRDHDVVTRAAAAPGAATQSWVITPVGENEYKIQQKSNNRFLDAYEDAGNDYSARTRPAQDNDSQIWVLVPLGVNVYSMQQKNTKNYLDAYESGSDHTAVMRKFQDNDSQRWVIMPECVDLTGDYTYTGPTSGSTSFTSSGCRGTSSDWEYFVHGSFIRAPTATGVISGDGPYTMVWDNGYTHTPVVPPAPVVCERQWVRHVDTFSSGLVDNDATSNNVEEMIEMCKNKPACHAVTCTGADAGACTMRASKGLGASPTGEVTWLKCG